MKIDFGCGAGIVSPPETEHWLIKNGGDDAFGIDIDEAKINRIEKIINNGTTFICADGCRLPFTAQSVEYIHINGVFHHIKDYRRAIKEIQRVLKIGGTLELYETVTNNPFYNTARRVWGTWKGDKIYSWFSTRQLESSLTGYFEPVSREYLWRAVTSDILCMLDKEPGISRWINRKVSKFTGELFCCHYHGIFKRR